MTLRLLLLVALSLLPRGAGAAEATDPGYVGSAACADCHEAATEAWADSHHALAWTRPGPGTVAADFDGTSFEGGGLSVRFREEGGRYHADVTESDGSMASHAVHSVVGVEPLQQYLFETEPGRLQSFDVVWDTEEGGWFHLYPDQTLPPGDGLHWTGPYKTWNARCAECHATGYEKNYDPATRTYASTEVEIGVGCEACHGPGRTHVDWAASLATTQAPPPPRGGFAVDVSDPEAAMAQCAGCHSRREAHGEGNPLPGTPYHDAYNLALLQPGLYTADGQQQDEVFVWGSFLQSRMYANGVICGDCHEAHSAELVADGNAVCAQCHSPAGNPRFPTLTPADYDSPAHHFHEAGTPGAECRNCHMVERAYMGNDLRADHSFRIPRPDLAGVTGAYDACTACHAGQTPGWAASVIAGWYPGSDNRGPHYGEVLAAGRADPAAAAGALGTLAADGAQPGIVRATALWLLKQAGDPAAADLGAPMTADPDPLVRAAAAGLQAAAAPQERVARLIPMLDDPAANVRIEAARAMLGAPVLRLPEAASRAMGRALGEWQAALRNRADFPETHMVLGGTALVMRNPGAAAAAFREAVRLDPQLAPAWGMLVRLAAATEGPEAARAVLEEALAAVPGAAELQALRAQLP